MIRGIWTLETCAEYILNLDKGFCYDVLTDSVISSSLQDDEVYTFLNAEMPRRQTEMVETKLDYFPLEESGEPCSYWRFIRYSLLVLQVVSSGLVILAGSSNGQSLQQRATVWPGGEAYGLGNTNEGRFTTFGRGLLVLNAKGEVIGGIGASTGTQAQDQQVVQAGVSALEEVLRRRMKAKL
ncbi:hypothetical protein BGZ57DRAFT_847488 [Hyaloscypha finlandica]|nr:hypothetical protein BGZ57DRAFT_847488 [Hyaloscypha finlandica]